MALIVKTLALGTISATGSFFIYRPSAANASVPKAALVKGIRLLNTGATDVTVKLYFVPKGTQAAQDALTIKRWLVPRDMKLPPGLAVIDDVELTLSPGDSTNNADAIYADASVINVVNFAISGLEKEY
jgi:hypothetical protein